MILSVRSKIVLIAIAILVVALVTNTLIGSYFFNKEYSGALQSNAFVIGQSLKFQLDRLLSLGIPLEKLTGFEEQCQYIVKRYDYISYAMIVDIDGKILFHNDPSQHGRILTDSVTLKNIRAAKNVIQLYSKDVEEYYDVIIPVFGIHDEHVGAVRTGFPSNVVLNKTNALIYNSVWVALASFGIAISLLVFAVSIWVTKPLMKLLDVIQDIRKKGTFNKRVEIESRDEIGQLSHAFNGMIDDLKKSRKELEKHSEGLEKEVRIRTEELQEKVEQLEKFNKFSVGREIRMIELKKRIKELEGEK